MNVLPDGQPKVELAQTCQPIPTPSTPPERVPTGSDKPATLAFAPAGERAAITPAVAPAKPSTSTAATSTRRRRIRRFASAISGSSARGSRGTCTVIAPLSVAPRATASLIAQGSFRNTGPGVSPHARACLLDSAGRPRECGARRRSFRFERRAARIVTCLSSSRQGR
jgi:hypothetical protein